MIRSFLLCLLSCRVALCGVPAQISGVTLEGVSYTRALKSSEGKPTLVVFLSSKCPCSISHEPALTSLQKKFPQVVFIGILSNLEEGLDDAKVHFLKSGLPFSILDDRKQTLANLLGALKTPHAFLFNPSGELVYQGGVDDSHEARRAKKHFLSDALAATIAGLKPEVSEARVLGCAISR